MDIRILGDIDVSAVGIGCLAFGDRVDAGTVPLIIHAALDVGVNFFDTGDVYSSGASEELLGRAIAGNRHEVIVASKFGHSMGALAAERGILILELVMSWLGTRSVVASVIAGVTRPEQVLPNVAAFGRALFPSDPVVIDTLILDS